MAFNFDVWYMYLHTECVYDYDNWSSYFVVWGLDLPFAVLPVKFGMCGA